MPGPHKCDDLALAYGEAVDAHGPDSPEAAAAKAAYLAEGCPTDATGGIPVKPPHV